MAQVQALLKLRVVLRVVLADRAVDGYQLNTVR